MVGTMEQKAAVGNTPVPQLRFKDDNGADFAPWVEKRLDTCLIIENGFPFKSQYFTTDNNGVPLIRIRDINAKKMNTFYTGLFDEKYLVDNGDVIIGMDGEFVVSKWDKDRALLNQRVMRIKNNDGYILDFLHHLLKPIVKYIEDIAPQTTVKHLSNKDIYNSVAFLPVEDEQQKISNFLSALDTRIDAQSDKIKALSEQKKALMQKIFAQELRFTDENGRGFAPWEVTTLGKLTIINTGNKDGQDAVENGEYPFFIRSQKQQTINSYSFDGEAILIPGDGNIGKIFHYINGKFDYHQRVYKISDFKDNVSGKYIYYYLRQFFLKEALMNSVKATVDSLRLPTIKGMHIKLPSLPEQQKIATFLSKLDERIELEQDKLDAYRDEKKAFMQRMFV